MIKKIRIKNFKSFKEDEITLPDFTVLIGRNGAGKTTLLQSLYILKKLSQGDEIDDIMQDLTLGNFEIFNAQTGEEEIEFEITFQINEDTFYNFFLKFGYKDKTSTIAKYALIIMEERLSCVDEKLNKTEKVYERSKDKIYNSEGKDVPLSVDNTQLALSFFKENHAKAAKRHLSNLNFVNHSLSQGQRAAVASESDEKNTLSSILLHLMKKAPKDFETFKKIVSKLMPQFSDIRATDFTKTKNQEERYFMLLESKNMANLFSFMTLSSGDFRLLYFFSLALLAEPFSSIMIDEIENGLHPYRLQEVIERLEVISQKKDLQFLFTSHSPLVINNFKPKDILFITNKENGSKILKVEDHIQSNHINEFLNRNGELNDLLNMKFK